MTQARCFQCGVDKSGPLAPCGRCGSVPRTESDLSLSIILCRQLSSEAQLKEFGQQLQSGQALTIPDSLMAKVREALKHPQLAALLRVGRKMGDLADTAPSPSPPTAAPASGDAVARSVPAHESPPPGKETVLHRNAFWLLGASTRDNRRRLVELAEEKALGRDADACQKARADLTNSRKRLTAEIAWLPGVSPARAVQLAERLLTDPLSIRSESGLPALAQANLLAASFEGHDAQDAVNDLPELVIEISTLADEVAADDVLRDINEDRAIAGFPAISSIDEIEAALAERKRHFRDSIKGVLDRVDSSCIVDVMTRTLDDVTCGGEVHAPEVIDLLVISYEDGSQEFLIKEAENVRTIIEAVREAASQGLEAVTKVVDRLERTARNWDRIAQPIQLGFKARGARHGPSMELANVIRELGVDLFNEHDMIVPAQRITSLLQELFAELPELVEHLDEDADTLSDILRRSEESEAHKEEWERDITYSAEVGTVFKSTLSISPKGVSWKGQNFPLESVTRVRWGGTQHSINGIPTGTTYTIAFGDGKYEAVAQLRRQEVFISFIERLWNAVGVRLLIELLASLKAGNEVHFGAAQIRDDGVTLPRHKLWGSERVTRGWQEVRIWNADGCFCIGAEDDNKAYTGLSYLEIPNTHILERMIRAAFKKPGMRVLSDLVEG